MRRTGFTLPELLVVIAIISILSALAVPSYSKYVAKEKLKRAQADLEFISLRLEHRYQRILSYPGTPLPTTADLQAVVPKFRPTSSATEFNFSTSDSNFAGYDILATGLSGLLQNCVVSLSDNGAKAITNCNNLASDGNWL